MTFLNCNDNTAKICEVVCERLDLTDPELIDKLIENLDPTSDLGKAFKDQRGSDQNSLRVP